MDMLPLELIGVSHAQIPCSLSSGLSPADGRSRSLRSQHEKPYPKSSSPPEQAIRNWVKQDDLDNGRREDGLTTEERSELRRLRRENKKLKIEREILAKDRDTLWVADITYMSTHAGFLYLSVVIDAYSRRVVGRSMANHLRSELVTDALDMALGQRRPDGVIHHSDQGSQYTSVAFGKRCRQAGVSPSMGSVGD